MSSTCFPAGIGEENHTTDVTGRDENITGHLPLLSGRVFRSPGISLDMDFIYLPSPTTQAPELLGCIV